jgi:hypothetical protein
VIGISLLQALLGEAGFLAAGICVLAFLALLLGIVQIGPTMPFLPIVVWSWTAMEALACLTLTAFMIPVGLVDRCP